MLAPRKVLWSTPNDVIDTIFHKWILSEYTKRIEQQQQQQQQQQINHCLPSQSSESSASSSSSSLLTIVDIGCGDGRVLLRWVELFLEQISNHNNNNNVNNSVSETIKEKPNDSNNQKFYLSLIGIDIDDKRINDANTIRTDFITKYNNTNNIINNSIQMYSNNEYLKNIKIEINVVIEFYCQNALECNYTEDGEGSMKDENYIDNESEIDNNNNQKKMYNLNNADIIFMYLIPRGLQLMRIHVIDPLLLYKNKIRMKSRNNKDTTATTILTNMMEVLPLLTCITYMSPLPTTTSSSSSIHIIQSKNTNKGGEVCCSTSSKNNNINNNKHTNEDSIIVTMKQDTIHVPVSHQPGSLWPCYFYQYL